MAKVAKKIVLDGEEVNVPSGVGGTSGEVYSTEETRIGTWIDGKPVYRRTFVGVSEDTNTQIFYGIDTLVNAYGNIKVTAKMGFSIPSLLGSDNLCYVVASFNSCTLRTLGEFSGKNFELTIEYTKTTD